MRRLFLAIILTCFATAPALSQSKDPGMAKAPRTSTEGGTTVLPQKNATPADIKAPTAPADYRKAYGDTRPSSTKGK